MQQGGHKEYYDFLGVPKDATKDAIRSAYKKKAALWHPDRNPGQEENFKKLQKVNEILSNDEKREIYDKYGEEGIEKGMGQGPTSIFDLLQGRGGREKSNKGPDFVKKIAVQLEDLYKGKTKKLKITKRILCTECNGVGTKNTASVKKCQSCGGKGQRIQMIQQGFMIQQVVAPCQDCSGKGETFNDPCTLCHGEKTIQGEKEVSLVIEAGMGQDQKITLSGEADQEPGMEPGDVVFIIHQVPHDVFERKGVDLYMKQKITLREALCGMKLHVKHLDDRVLEIRTKPGEVIKSGLTRYIQGEGMPTHKNIFKKGRLFIEFIIEFPNSGQLTAEQIQSLSTILPAPPARPYDNIPASEVDEVELSDATILKPEDFEAKKTGGEVYDEDEEHGHPGGVSCAQQ